MLAIKMLNGIPAICASRGGMPTRWWEMRASCSTLPNTTGRRTTMLPAEEEVAPLEPLCHGVVGRRRALRRPRAKSPPRRPAAPQPGS